MAASQKISRIYYIENENDLLHWEKEVRLSNLVMIRERKMIMKKIAKSSFLFLVSLSLLVVTTAVYANTATIPTNFYIGSYFSGSGASRTGTCYTGIYTPSSSNRAAVKCELQNNAGSRIDYKSKTGSFGGSGVSVTDSNLTGDTGRLVLFSAHDMWVNATDYVEYRQIQSNS